MESSGCEAVASLISDSMSVSLEQVCWALSGTSATFIEKLIFNTVFRNAKVLSNGCAENKAVFQNKWMDNLSFFPTNIPTTSPWQD